MAREFLFKTTMSIFAAAALVALSACGDDITEVTEVTQTVGMQIVEKGEAMPACTAENEGAIVYSVDSAVSYACVSREWIPMKGKDGVEGKEGKATVTLNSLSPVALVAVNTPNTGDSAAPYLWGTAAVVCAAAAVFVARRRREEN